jgi:UDP-N-acetylglucosamine diphosphorylase / glucose-1-phosphate thymidylyltransferase / UDP-N-acetylgalactosamine diphosphorylase / glucosamine-1-phosphate N-acetyltransferase / galactosamine-1-phosphate N-acetyltransferase
LKGVILAAGEGKRMRPLTAHRPKVMLPVAGRPILEHLVERLVEVGVDDLLVVTHYHGDAVRKHFRDGRRWRARITYIDQGTAGGTGHAVAALRGRLRSRFLLAYGDALFGSADLAKLVGSAGMAVAAKRVEDARPYGLLDVAKGRLRGVEEKPTLPKAGWVNAGAYLLEPSVIAACARLTASPRGEFELTDAVAQAAAEGDVRVVPTPTWRDIGQPWDLLAAQEELLQGLEGRVEGRVDASAILEGPVVVEKGAHVRHHSVIEGPAIIQAGARVGPHAYIRPGTVIGPGCHVGASVELKNVLLMERSHVPHLSYVGDSVIGAGCNLGAGTNVANLKHTDRTVRVQLEDGTWVDTGRRKFGVVLGDGVKTGINATLNVGAILAAGARVLPGRVVSGHVPAGAWVA